ncbi:MAG TPA: ATP-dependent sacrificial sulfur transferase LarE [Actinomycetota bacterium]|nr:ATP-dependent sacrificial sulfur transferase LarE [Actinomycetota bacterium]
MNRTPEAKERELSEHIAEIGAVVVAYSGGVDSAYLASVCHEVLGERALAVTAVSPSLSRRERRDAEALAAREGWNHMTVETHEVGRDEYARNGSDRCYWCKTELFEVLAPISSARAARIAVGTNLDDLSEHRPGGRAARENDVLTPLADAGLSKAEIRELAAVRNLPVADKPASPCLASRFAYGVRVTPEGLARVDKAEEALRGLGFGVLRVRDHGDLARIELEPDEIERAGGLRSEIAVALRALGFKYVTLDLEGFRSGSLNEALLQPTFASRLGSSASR